MSKGLASILVFVLLSTACLVLANQVSGAFVGENQWVSKKPMPKGKADYGLAQVNGKIYAIGGYPNPNITEEYDPNTDSWTTKAAMPTARFNFAIATFENKIYCIGGSELSSSFYQSSLVSGAIEVYDPARDTWEIKNPMPTPMTQLEANVVNDKIYLVGGRTGGQYSTVSTNQVYDPITESWTSKAPMSYPVADYASTVINGKIYVIGGQDEFNNPMNLNTTQIYDIKQDSWSFGHPLAFALLDSAACTLPYSNTIYLVGGQIGSNGSSTATVQVYDVDNDKWVFGPSLNTARFRLSIVVIGNSIYAMGGISHYILPTEQASTENERLLASNETPNSTPTPTIPEFPTLIIPISLVIIAAGLLVYSKKHKHPRKFTFNEEHRKKVLEVEGFA